MSTREPFDPAGESASRVPDGGRHGEAHLLVDPKGSPNFLGPKLTPPQIGERPAEPKPFWYVAMIILAQFGIFLALLGPVMVSMQLKINTLTDDPIQQAAMIGMVLPWGALAAVIFNVVGGRISDRTTGKFGRRRLWMIVGTAGLLVALFVISQGTNVWTLAIGWFIAQSFSNLAFASFMASLADQLSMKQYGTVSGLVGVAQNVGIMGATWMGSFFSHNMLLLFMVPAVIGFVLMTLYALCVPEPVLLKNEHPFSVKELLSSFWFNPREHPDFMLVWAGRFLITLAAFMFTTFRLLYMTRHLGLEQDEAVDVVAVGVTIYTVALMVAGVVGGALSDRFQRRKVWVAASCVLFGLGTYLLFHAETVGFFYVCEIILGLAYGVYVAVDLALALSVLPDPANAGKDLGILNMANALPQSLAPAVGAWALASLGAGENFMPLLVIAAVSSAIGGGLTMLIKGVR